VTRVTLGLSIGPTALCAVLVEREAVRWAASAGYTNAEDLADAIARLAGEAPLPVRRARVALERAVVQLRSVRPAPPLPGNALPRYVALEAPRLFRRNGAPLVTDATLLRLARDDQVLWAAAAAEPLLRAVTLGCAGAGLRLDGIGPAADVLPAALVPTDGGAIMVGTEGEEELLELCGAVVWRSRLIAPAARSGTPKAAFTPALTALGDDAARFAAAYAVALAAPRLALWPPEERALRERTGRRRLLRLAVAGAGLWLAAAGVYAGRLAWTLRDATRALGSAASAVDSALAVRRDLGLGQATLATMANAERARSRHLALLAGVTRVLGDSAYLVALQVASDGTVRMVGYANSAARVVAQLERVTLLSEPRLEGPVTREQGAGSRERFAILARLEARR
jgi:hypothetical protein